MCFEFWPTFLHASSSNLVTLHEKSQWKNSMRAVWLAKRHTNQRRRRGKKRAFNLKFKCETLWTNESENIIVSDEEEGSKGKRANERTSERAKERKKKWAELRLSRVDERESGHQFRYWNKKEKKTSVRARGQQLSLTLVQNISNQLFFLSKIFSISFFSFALGCSQHSRDIKILLHSAGGFFFLHLFFVCVDLMTYIFNSHSPLSRALIARALESSSTCLNGK